MTQSTAREFLEKQKENIRYSVTFRLFTIAALIIVLLIPMSMITGLIHEREGRREEAIREVNAKWGRAQTLTGPILTIPYRLFSINDKGERIPHATKFACFLPEKLEVNASVDPEIRYRGIYEVALYRSAVSMTGHFLRPDLQSLGIHPYDVLWDEATVSIGIPDLRGLQESLAIQWNRENLTMEPSGSNGGQISQGLTTAVKIDSVSSTFDFSFAMQLKGSQNLSFTPMGKDTHVKLTSGWANPSFNGAFLPDVRQVDAKGFQAEWKVLHVNRNFPQQWKDKNMDLEEAAFGVDLFVPLDEYHRSLRSAKYALLIIALTFLLFFAAEMQLKRRIHPIQYLMVGLALSIFYVLLVSISEHLTFNIAYLVASVSVVTLISIYAKGAMKNNRISIGIGASLLLLYAFIFMLLQSEDYALLIGSIGLFGILAAMMYFSRNIDWYTLAKGKTGTPGSNG